jgi:DNA-binding transcriptional LysR family regulator
LIQGKTAWMISWWTSTCDRSVTFIAVAEELHFSRAADRLHLDQPTLSRNIRRLEQRLAVKLLDRTNRRVELTAAGQAFLGKAREAIEAADSAVRAARTAAGGERLVYSASG